VKIGWHFTSYWIGNDGEIRDITNTMVAELANHLWKKRGSPIGSPEVDWEQARGILTRLRNSAEVVMSHTPGGEW
jgi:hypothetical protein